MIAFFGRFQSLTISIRDATETYLELGQRIPIYLNGEIQIAWVLEQGLVDMAFIVKTFGIKQIRRDQVISRGPRFHIAFDANAADRVETEGQEILPTKPLANGGLRSLGSGFGTTQLFNTNQFSNGNVGDNQFFVKPDNSGRYELMRCKVDSVSLGVMPGRRVAAVRWEGVSEGVTWSGESVQTFKNNLNSLGVDSARVQSTFTGGSSTDTNSTGGIAGISDGITRT